MTPIPTPAELYRLAYVPGSWTCPECGFVLNKSTIRANVGDIGTSESDRQSEPCPNDGEWLIPTTYKSVADGLCDRMTEVMEERIRLREALAALTETAEVERLKKALAAVIKTDGLRWGGWLASDIARVALGQSPMHSYCEGSPLFAELSASIGPPTALPTESPNEEFERLAAEFRKATRLMAPGKDDPSGSATREERNAAWESWLKARPTALDAQEEKRG